MSAAVVIVGYALREALRRRVFTVVIVLTLGFLGLYWLGAREAFEDTSGFSTGVQNVVDTKAFTGATIFGMAMFATLFLGIVLTIFLTLSVVRGDAERGLLQPMLVRPVPRRTLLFGRWLGASSVCALYVIVVTLAAFVITHALGGWWPDRTIGPLLSLAVGVAIIAALSLAGSVTLAATANGIAIFMLFGAGLTAGLLGQIAEALGSGTLDDVARIASWILPFEALYQAGLGELTADTVGFTRLAIDLGPFGGAQSGGPELWLWSLVYLALVGAAATAAFARRDL